MNERTISKCLGVFAFALTAGCNLADDSDRIVVTEPNDLGVISLQTTQVADHGNTVFTLDAFTADGEQVASLHRTIGVIADISQKLPGEDDVGSEIRLSVRGSDMRALTRETVRFDLNAVGQDPIIARFLELDTVLSTLESASIFVVKPQSATTVDQPYYGTQGCTANMLLTSPVAQQCCYDTGSNLRWVNETVFVRPSDGWTVTRIQYSPNSKCKNSDGVSSCLGVQCFYGPQSFSKPTVTSPPGAYTLIAPKAPPNQVIPICTAEGFSTPQTHLYPDLSGTNPTGQGCPGGNQGNYAWDY